MNDTKAVVGQTCRACLRQSTSEMFSLAFYHVNLCDAERPQMEFDATLADIYTQCTQLFFDSSNPLSEWVCHKCSNKLIEFFQFRKMCIESFNYLKHQKHDFSENLPKENGLADKLVENTDADIKKENNANYTELNYLDPDALSNSSDEIFFDSMNINLEIGSDEQNIIKIDKTVDNPKTKCRKSFPVAQKETEETIVAAAAVKKVNETAYSNGLLEPFEFVCDVNGCGKTYRLKASLRQHIMSIHVGLPRRNVIARKVCHECDKSFFSNASLIRHSYTHTGERPFKCHICPKMFTAKDKLDDHLKRHENIRPHVCPTCGLAKVSMYELRIHMKCHAPAEEKDEDSCITCTICEQKFYKRHRYDAHIRMHRGLKQWSCKLCEKEFVKYSSLKKHIASVHDDVPKEFICDVNGCGKVYSTKETLRKHINTIHLGLVASKKCPLKICEQCGKVFKTNAALLKHSYTHTRVTPHKCHICPKMFPTQYKLKEHLMRHEGIKNHVCPECGLRKTTMNELRVHMNYHTREKQFPCKFCPKVFSRCANRTRHTRIVHCGIKAFQCTHCDSSFGKAETLKHHIMRHTGEKPQECSICFKRFIQATALKTHMKTHNKNLK